MRYSGASVGRNQPRDIGRSASILCGVGFNSGVTSGALAGGCDGGQIEVLSEDRRRVDGQSRGCLEARELAERGTGDRRQEQFVGQVTAGSRLGEQRGRGRRCNDDVGGIECYYPGPGRLRMIPATQKLQLLILRLRKESRRTDSLRDSSRARRVQAPDASLYSHHGPCN